MAEVQSNQRLRDGDRLPDRREHSRLNRVRRAAVSCARNRWVAMFIVAFSVSWAFHQVDEVGQHRIERQQRILTCTIEGVAIEQTKVGEGQRVPVGPILQACEKHGGK